MEHLCYNRLDWYLPFGRIPDNYLQYFPPHHTIRTERQHHHISRLFTTINQPPVAAYQQLALCFPGSVLEACYLDEFGLFAGTVKTLPQAVPGCLMLTPVTAETDKADLANCVFDLDWPQPERPRHPQSK